MSFNVNNTFLRNQKLPEAWYRFLKNKPTKIAKDFYKQLMGPTASVNLKEFAKFEEG